MSTAVIWQLFVYL